MMGAGGSAAHQRADGPPPPGTDPVFDKMVEDELARRKDQGGAAKPGASAPPVPGEDPVFDAMVKQEMERQKYEVDAFAGALGARDGRGPARAEPSASPRAARPREGGAGAMARLERDMRAERDAYGGQGYGRAPEPARAAPSYGAAAAPYGVDGGQPSGDPRRDKQRQYAAALRQQMEAPRRSLRGGDDDWQRARRAPPPREPQSGYGDPYAARAPPGPTPAAAPAHGPPPWAHGDVGRDPYEPAPLGRGMATIQGANPPRQLGGRKDAQAAYAAELEAQMREKADRDRFHRNRDMAASRERLRGYPPSPTRDDGGAYGGGAHGGAPQQPGAYVGA